MAGAWIKDGFITYGYNDWHYFPVKGKISACNAVIAHQRGWLNSVSLLPDTATKINTCLACKKVSDKSTPQVSNPVVPFRTGTCEKNEYFSEAEAGRALIHIKIANKNGRNENRVYHCKTCNSWHLTSKK